VSRTASREGASLVLRGDTFPIKERLKEIGSRWDGVRRAWVLPFSATAVASLRQLGFHPLPDEETETQLQESAEQAPAKIWSVKELVTHMGVVIATHLGGSYWVCGEISSHKSSNGHQYFDLAEAEEEVSIQTTRQATAIACVLWAGRRKMLLEKSGAFELTDGLKVKLLVHLEFRRDSSRLSAVVDDIDLSFTLGDMALNRQNLVRELRRRGLYDRNRGAFLPTFPLRVALVTAHKSRAFSDFFDEIRSSGFSFSVTLFDANMQGASTSTDIGWAMDEIARREDEFDCVVITRGGGSRLDLRWFDDMEICKAIAYSTLPVITAIGHFEDVSVADEVAFIAEKTPTGAARFLANTSMQNLHSLFLRAEQTAHQALRRLTDEGGRLARFEQALTATVMRRTAEERARVNQGEIGLKAAVHRRLKAESNGLDALEQTLRLLRNAHERTLDRGFALLRSPQGKALSAIAFEGETPPAECVIVLRDSPRGRTIEITAEVIHIEITQTRDPSLKEPVP
jgi:exodeoxyribonuclease VII large subunit